MGHLVNPISFRLGWFSFWHSSSVVCNFFEYSYLFLSDFNLYRFFKWFFKDFNFIYNSKKLSFFRLDILFMYFKLLRVNNKLTLYFFFFDYNFYNIMCKIIFEYRYPDILSDLELESSFLRKKGSEINFLSLDKTIRNKYIDLKLSRIVKNRFYKLLIFFFNNFWFGVFDIISVFFNKLFKGFSINFSLFLVKNKFTQALLVSDYIVKLLRKRLFLKKIIKKVHRSYFRENLLYNHNIIGYKIVCSGRFDRKKRATYYWKFYGKLPFSSMYIHVDYHLETVILKYGICAIKVYVFKLKSNPLNLYLPLCSNYISYV